MLHRISNEEYELYKKHIYSLSADLSRCAFPIYSDGVKTEEFFYARSFKGLASDSEEILLYERDGRAEGWIHYYFIAEDRYLGISSMLIENGFDKAIGELFDYWSKKYAGYSWCLYLPTENSEGLDFMEEKGNPEVSRSVVDVLLFKNYRKNAENGNVIAIDKNNFELFGNIHSRYDGEMYWNSDRIKKDMDRWRIFAYMGENGCLGVLYYICAGRDLEIFGIDYADEKYDPDVTEALLISGLNRAEEEGAESMYFFNDEETHTAAEKLGFVRMAEACCFEGEI